MLKTWRAPDRSDICEPGGQNWHLKNAQNRWTEGRRTDASTSAADVKFARPNRDGTGSDKTIRVFRSLQ